jgi:hypothetical protein
MRYGETMPSNDWFSLLTLARELSPDSKSTFTAPHLAAQSGRERDVKIASGWLYKFRKWGYVDVVGTVQGSSIRPLNVYVVTEKGHACKPRAGRELQLRQLLEAIVALRKAKGAKNEAAAATALFKLADEIGG